MAGTFELIPNNDRIIVKETDAESVTPGGIHLPDMAREKTYKGCVVAVGPGRCDESGDRIPLDLKVGDTVLYSRYGGNEIEYKGEKYLVMLADDVLAKLVD